jgi:O-antigen/teichoic acid export membrane protein
VLEILGVEDYGIYNAVVGVVSLFSFIQGALLATSNRFLAFELGRNDIENFQSVFTHMFILYVVFGLVYLFFVESIGMWFVLNKLVIPPEKITSATIVYQCIIISYFIELVSFNFQSALFAYENMTAYAIIAIINTLFKLLAVLLLQYIALPNKLVLYAILLDIVSIITTAIYILYSKVKYGLSVCIRKYKPGTVKILLSYFLWNMAGTGALTVKANGTTIILNLFFGPIVNSARGVATQIGNAVTSLAQNFRNAFRPQITKIYASNEKEKLYETIIMTSKLSFFLVFVFSFPAMLEMSFILSVWLKDVPPNTIDFSIMTLLSLLVEVIEYPVMSAVMATGAIKGIELTICLTGLFSLLLVYITLGITNNPITAYMVMFFIDIILLFIWLFFAKRLISLSIKTFTKKVFIPIMKVVLVSSPIPLILYSIIKNMSYQFFVTVSISVLLICLCVLFFGLSKNERETVFVLAKAKIHLKGN